MDEYKKALAQAFKPIVHKRIGFHNSLVVQPIKTP